MLDELQSTLRHRFANENLLREALTQAVETPVESSVRSNALLAWLGDAVVEFVVTEALYSSAARTQRPLPDKERQDIVSENYLANVAKGLDLGGQIVNSMGKPMPVYQVSSGALAKGYEAVVAAIYVDAGLEKAREFVRRTLKLNPRDRRRRSYNSHLQI